VRPGSAQLPSGDEKARADGDVLGGGAREVQCAQPDVCNCLPVLGAFFFGELPDEPLPCPCPLPFHVAFAYDIGGFRNSSRVTTNLEQPVS
jgi:hypothetical protein